MKPLDLKERLCLYELLLEIITNEAMGSNGYISMIVFEIVADEAIRSECYILTHFFLRSSQMKPLDLAAIS